MGKYGTNLEGFGAFEGGVNADKGAPLVSTSSDGETSLIFGPAALRTIQSFVSNGDFAVPPDAAGDTITAENPLPYWTFTDNSSVGAITCAIVTDSGSGSGNILRWTVAANTASKAASITRYVPINATRDRAYSYSLEVTAGGATSASNRTLTIQIRYYKADLTTTGSAATQTLSFNNFINTTTAYIIANTERLNAPADAAYARIYIEIAATTTNASSAVLDLYEVKLIPGMPMILVADRNDPATYGPGAMWKTNGITSVDTAMPTSLTAGYGKLQVSSSDVTVTSPFISTDAGTGIDARLVQTETLIVDGTSAGADQITIPDTLAGAGLTIGGDTNLYRSAANTLKTDDSFVIGGANSNLLARISYTTTQSLTNNTATKLTFDTASSSPTTGSYDPQGWFDNANDRITIGQAGFYTISANVGFATNATGRRIVQIFVNGADRGSVQVAALSGNTTILSVSTNVYLAVNDYVEVFALQQSGGALNTVFLTGVYPSLSVGRIGA